MVHTFEVEDKTGRRIRLTKERWKHITQEHPNIQNFEELKETLINPLKIMPSTYDPENVQYYYKFNKKKKRYLMVAVKYLNGEGFIITTYYMRNIK